MWMGVNGSASKGYPDNNLQSVVECQHCIEFSPSRFHGYNHPVTIYFICPNRALLDQHNIMRRGCTLRPSDCEDIQALLYLRSSTRNRREQARKLLLLLTEENG